MIRAIDRLLAAAASLKLAIVTILLLAGYLAVGTIYESKFGTRAASVMVYQSFAFYGVMALLALNVMAAAIARFPWKRHQAGFVVTHIGIEVLLLGCLIGARRGIDGRMILRPGQSSSLIELPGEQIVVRDNAQSPVLIVPIDPSTRGVYPGVAAFLFRDLWTAELPVSRIATSPRLAERDGVAIDLIEVAPAARIETTFVSASAGEPAARVRIFGTTPDGATIDQVEWFSANQPAELFGGQIRLRLRGEKSDVPQRARGELLLWRDGAGWRGTIFGVAGIRESFAVQPGQPRAAWMGLSLVIEELLDHATAQSIVTPIRVPIDRVDSSVAAAKVRISTGSESAETWVVRGEPFTTVQVGDRSIEMAYGFEAAPLPFEVRLTDASVGRNSVPQANVEVERGERRTSLSIAPNQPGVVEGRAIYLSSVETVMGAPIAFLSVRHDPGWPVKYAGSGLIVLGTLMMFVIRKNESDFPLLVLREGARGRVEREVHKPPSTLPPTPSLGTWRGRMILAIPLLLAAVARGEVALDAVRTIPIQHGDRIAPLDTVARETVRFIRGRETADSLRSMLEWSADPASAQSQPIISVQRLDLRALVGLKDAEKFVAASQLRQNGPAMRWLAEMVDRQRLANDRGEMAGFTARESAGLQLHARLMAFDAVANRSVYRISTIANSASAGAMVDQMLSLFAAGEERLLADFAKKVSSPLSVSQIARLQREVLFNRLHSFRWVGLLYAIVLSLFIGAQLPSDAGLKPPAWKTLFSRGAMLGLGIAVVCHALAFAWRCSITGWAPVTNMYETVIWVGGVAAVIGLILAMATRAKVAAVGGSLLALLACVVGDVMPAELGSSVQTLAPVLQSNLWLTVHVLTVVSSYAAFAMALVLGNVALWRMAGCRLWVVGRRLETIDDQPPTTNNLQLTTLIYRTVQIGVVLIAAGTVLGAMWADVSWGRFWGWDPKEVWALVVLLSYLALLHGKAAGWAVSYTHLTLPTNREV